MKRWKKAGISVGIILILLITIMAGIFLRIKVNQKHEGDALYADVQSALVNYPVPQAPYECTKIYYCDGGREYMLLREGDLQVTGVRPIGGEAVYYTGGKSWTMNTEGELIAIGIAEDPIEDTLREVVKKLLVDQDVTYSYHYASGMPLPMWVYPGEDYIKCVRIEYPANTEIMACGEDNGEKYIRWNILNSDESVILFLFMREGNLEQEEIRTVNLAGWEDADHIYRLIFE